jgi:undecaprenyl-diphosphatase
LDRDLFLLLNGWHGTVGDAVFTLLSGRLPWIPVGILLAVVLVRQLGWREALLVVLGAGLVILLADQLSASVLKPWTMRLRPCHSPDLEGLVHLPTGRCGGNYGFVSSHAANFFGLAVFLGVVLGRGWVLASLLVVAGLVGYSRIYLGVHYPGDVLGGAILGSGLGWLVAWLYAHWRLRLLEFIHKRA